MWQRIWQAIKRQFENQYGRNNMQTKPSAASDFSGLTQAGKAFVPPVAPVPTPPVVEAVPTLSATEPVTTVAMPTPQPVQPSEVVSSSKPEKCSHIFICTLCHQRLLPGEHETSAPAASGPSPLTEEWNSFERVDLPTRTPEQIKMLLPFETADSRTKRILNDKQRYLHARGL